MSIKTLAGISAATILSILAGNAYGELANDLKATKSNGCETANNVSTTLGGTNICAGFASFVQVYNRGTDNYAATLGANGSSYGNGALFATHNGDWSSLVAVKLSATENTIIWSTGRYYGGATGLALIQKDSSTVALVKWTTEGFAEIASASVTAGKYHTILVTHKYTAAVEEPETAAQSVYTIYVDGVATADTTASIAAYTDLDDSGFQYGSVHGALPTGLNNTAGILMDEAGVWTSKCLTAEEAATVAAEFVYNDVTIHEINISADTNWSAVAPASIGENDVIEIRSNSKTLTFDAAETVIPCKVVFVSGLTRVVNPGNVSMTGEVVVNQGAELWIECEGVAANEEVPTIADDITVYGTIRPHNLSTTAGGDATITTDETTKVHFAQNMTLAGGELHVEDGHVVFTGTINVAEGTTAKYTPKWRKASIIKTLNVPETATFKMSPNLSSDGAGSLIKIAGGTIAGRVELSGNNKATKLQASDALAGKTLYLTSGGKIDLSGQTVGFEKIVVEGGTTAAPNEINGNGNNGTVEIAANAVVKDIHTGGNKIYTYSGAGSTSSTLIVTGSTDWGIADGASLSNLKLSVQDASHIYYIERGIGDDVSLEAGEGARISIANPKTFATVSGTGTIQVSRWPQADNSITLTGASTFEGTITTPVKLANGSSLTLTNGGTVSADPTAVDSTKRVNKVETTEGEGEEAVTTTTYTLVQTYQFTLNSFADEDRVKVQYQIGGTSGEWTDYSAPVSVDAGGSLYFRYVSVDETKWTVTYSVSGLQYTNVRGGATYNPDKSKLTVTSVTPPTPTYPEAMDGGSVDQQSAYATWATTAGVTDPKTAGATEGFILGITADEITAAGSLEAAVKTKLDTLCAQIDLSALAAGGEGALTAAVAELNKNCANGTFSLTAVPTTEINTTASLFRLTVEFLPANGQN